MVFEHIEKLKQEYTDKYVTVDEQRPELQRFGHMTGIVKTVNMNGRALVEFDGLENIGWYDIEIDFLKVVDKPVVHETTKKKPAAKKKADVKHAKITAGALKKHKAATSKLKTGLAMAITALSGLGAVYAGHGAYKQHQANLQGTKFLRAMLTGGKR